MNKLSSISKRKKCTYRRSTHSCFSYCDFINAEPSNKELPKSILQLRLAEEIRGKQAQEIAEARVGWDREKHETELNRKK